MPTQIKGPDGSVYGPHRDVVNIVPLIVREAFTSLQCPWMGYFGELLEANKITEEDVVEGVACFNKAAEMFLREGIGEDMAEAFEKAGFLQLNSLVRLVIFERIGEVAVACFFAAIRECTFMGQVSPVHDPYIHMLSVMKTYVEQKTGQAVPDLPVERVLQTKLQYAEMEHRRIERQQLEERDRLMTRIAELESANEELGLRIRATEDERDRAHAIDG